MADSKLARPVSVSQLTTADQLANKRKEMENLRMDDMREWALNRAFYRGDQWVFWNKVSSQVETLPVHDADKPRWKVRLTSNQVMPGVQHYVAQLTKNKPVIAATPDSSGYNDLCAAQMGEALFEYWWSDFNLRTKLQSALVNSCLSQGYWKITWDAQAGKSMKITVGPDGQPITNEDLASVFLEELEQLAEQQGADPQKVTEQFQKTIYVGDIRIDVMTGENVLIDPAACELEDAKYVICKHPMDVDEVWARYRVRVEPNASGNDAPIPLAYTRRKEEKPKNLRDVYIGYFKPSAVMPKGRYVVWIEGPNMILVDGPWPYPFSEIPLVKFPGIERPNSVLDEPIVTQVRPLQKELNRTLSQIVQFKDLTIKPQMIAPVGSLRQRLTDEPGAVFEYQPLQGLGPEWRQTPPLPNSIFATLADVQQRIDKAFNRIPSQRDQLPARSDSGYQLELMQEAVADQMSPVINRLEEALADAGKFMVLLAKEYYIEPRLLKIRGAGGSVQVKKFQKADLEGGFAFQAEAGTGLPRSRAGRQQQIMDLVDRQIMQPQTAMKYLDLADLRGIRDHYAADEDQAYREHDKLIKGEPINTAALQQAIPQIQQALAMGQLPAEQVQQVIEQTASQPLSFENSQTHLEIHGLYMKSPEFEKLPPDAQNRFMQHYDATYQRIIQLNQMQASLDPKVAPRVSINAHSTTSAPVMASALNRVGVMVDEQQVAQPPLETIVFDSIDKPDAEAAGNDPMDTFERAQAMDQAQIAHQQAMAKSAHDMSLAQQNAQQTADKHDMAMQQQAMSIQQQAELHQQRLNAMKQQAAKGGGKNG